jgi:hypothetical protein
MKSKNRQKAEGQIMLFVSMCAGRNQHAYGRVMEGKVKVGTSEAVQREEGRRSVPVPGNRGGEEG